MLSSIHPLGERNKGNRFPVTAAAFAVGAVGGGLATGAVAGLASFGATALLSADAAVVIAAVVVLAALVADIRGLTPPSLERQVDEAWLDHYRGWVYGTGFGVQLGLGVATYVTTWLTYATIVVAALTGTLSGALVVMGVFGLARGASLVLVRHVTSPANLRTVFARLERRAVPATQVTGLAALLVAMAVLVPVVV